MASTEMVPRRSNRQQGRVSVETSESGTRDYLLNVKKALERMAEYCLSDVKINHEVREGG